MRTLRNAVIKQLGIENKSYLLDIANHGADGGFPGFTYHTDTVSFFKRHHRAILAALKEDADSLGQSILQLVKSFRCLNNDYSEEEIARSIYGKVSRVDTQIANALAWYALERVAQEITI